MSGYEVLARYRGNGRKLECCREEVDDGKKKERRGESEPTETGVIFAFFFLRETETSGGSDAGLSLGVCGVSDAVGVPWLWFRHYL